MSENIVLEKSYKFALRIVRLYKFLCDEKREYVMSREVLRAGTKLGEHVKRSQEAASRPTFGHEINTALEYASATEFWLQLLHDAEYLGHDQFESINNDCAEMNRLLKSISRSVDPRTRN
ncbi:MAG: four helix bundle protein [Acidobacteria bacterium]|nr:four helix bundle protein [Acidobacteriota bacterium]